MSYDIDMKKIFFIILCVFMATKVFAFDIVYPKTTVVKIDSASTFFIGSSSEPIFINDKPVTLHESGAFAYYVDLKEGVNQFVIKTETESKTYIVTRPKKLINKYNPQNFIEFPQKKYLIVNNPNSPLRSTPQNYGINRIAHLQENVLLVSDGEKAGFYRVVLNNDKKAWIEKYLVDTTDEFENAKVNNYECEENDEFIKVTFHLDKRVPYEISEGESVKLDLFNTENDFSFEIPYKKMFQTDKLMGYSGQYLGNDFILMVRKYPDINKRKPLKNIKIVIDAGHGGKELGAIGCLGDAEKDINLNISKYLEKELKSRGADVILTRKEDEYMGLYDRVKFANEHNAMFFISIHNNALPDSLNPIEHRGTSVYYYYPQAKNLANKILTEINEVAGTKNDNVHQESFAVVRNTNALSVLVEIGYLINPDDNFMIINSIFQKNCAKSIANGIEKFLLEK